MNKKTNNLIKSFIIIIIVIIITILAIIFFYNNSKNSGINNNSVSGNVNGNTNIENNSNNGNNNENNNSSESENNLVLELPTEGNDYVIQTKSKTSLRVINEYDKSIFSKPKNLLIMFASWCPNCKEEISEIEKILKEYEGRNDLNIYVIAHEFNTSEAATIPDLISLVENDVDFGNIQVFIDLKRTIRKNIDPEASTIPVSYIVDENGNILNKFSESISLETIKEIL